MMVWRLICPLPGRGVSQGNVNQRNMRLAGMDPTFHESRNILPRQLAILLSLVMAATLGFLSYTSYGMDLGTPSWAVPVFAVITVVVIIIANILVLEVSVYDDRVDVMYCFKRMSFPFEEIIDSRDGELGDIRNYSKWSLKGVSHKAYTVVGDDEGVALKLTGKRVVVFSTAERATVAALIPRKDPESEE